MSPKGWKKCTVHRLWHKPKLSYSPISLWWIRRLYSWFMVNRSDELYLKKGKHTDHRPSCALEMMRYLPIWSPRPCRVGKEHSKNINCYFHKQAIGLSGNVVAITMLLLTNGTIWGKTIKHQCCVFLYITNCHQHHDTDITDNKYVNGRMILYLTVCHSLCMVIEPEWTRPTSCNSWTLKDIL